MFAGDFSKCKFKGDKSEKKTKEEITNLGVDSMQGKDEK